jgi:choline-sulfatase
MLFDIAADPHEQTDLAPSHPELVARARSLLDAWLADMLPDAARGRDPLMHVLQDGGPFHVRGRLADYLARLRETGRGELATALMARHGAP